MRTAIHGRLLPLAFVRKLRWRPLRSPKGAVRRFEITRPSERLRGYRARNRPPEGSSRRVWGTEGDMRPLFTPVPGSSELAFELALPGAVDKPITVPGTAAVWPAEAAPLHRGRTRTFAFVPLPGTPINPTAGVPAPGTLLPGNAAFRPAIPGSLTPTHQGQARSLQRQQARHPGRRQHR
jgi:hypothetical protein